MADLKRNERTPATEAIITVAWVWEWFDNHPDAFGMDAKQLRSEMDAAQSEGQWLDPDVTISEIRKGDSIRPFVAFAAAIVCAASAIGNWEKGRVNEAWTYAMDGRYWAGCAMDAMSSNENGATFAKLGADARHAENRAMKQDVIEAYLRGNFQNKDEAATALAGKLVPMKWRTVRDWLKNVER